MEKIKKECKLFAAVIVSVILGIIVGYFIFVFLPGRGDLTSKEIRGGGGTLTNPLLECEIGQDAIASKKIDFSDEIKEFVQETEIKNNVSDISVYVRDLNNGPVIGVDQELSFAPASLLKIPLLIAYLRWSEDNPRVLEEKIVFKEPADVGYTQKFAPSVPLELGKTYTAKELLENMIKYSDNQALVLLFEKLPKKYQIDLYNLVGVDPSLITDPTGRLTTKQYSIFFRILFNSSFLNQKNSEYALDLLTKTTFVDGIRAVVPNSILVAHKFGERKTREGLQQLHDCGIVYYPNHPYLICVMTRGTEVKGLVSSIQDVTEFIYGKIHSQYK